MLPKNFSLEAVMRAASSAISLSAHIAIVTAAVLGTARARTPERQPYREVSWVLPPSRPERGETAPVPGPIALPDRIDVPTEAPPVILPAGGAAALIFAVGAGVRGLGSGSGYELLTEDRPQALAGPLPVYPERLRQAGIQGRVVFEAIVDTTGLIDPHSLQVVLATNPGFVEAAKQALLATLFRPARVAGHAVRVKVRLPVEFTLRGMAAAR